MANTQPTLVKFESAFGVPFEITLNNGSISAITATRLDADGNNEKLTIDNNGRTEGFNSDTGKFDLNEADIRFLVETAELDAPNRSLRRLVTQFADSLGIPIHEPPSTVHKLELRGLVLPNPGTHNTTTPSI